MSIINQALKKAQRERLLSESQTVPGFRYVRQVRHPRRWPLLTVGFAVALGVGAVLHWWITVPVGRATVAVHPQASSPQPVVPMPGSSTVGPPEVPLPERREVKVPLLLPAGPRTAPAQPDTLPSEGKLPVARFVVSQPPRPIQQAAPSPAPLLPQPAAMPQERPGEPAPPDQSRARALFNQAIEAQEAGQMERAITLLQHTIELDPMLKVAYNSLGNIYYQQQQYQQALTMYQRALTIDPHYAKARNNLGSTYLRLSMDEHARQELHKVLEVDDTYGLAHYNLACVYARAGDSTMAAQHLQRAIALEPQARGWAQTDADFTRVRATPVVQQLLGP